MKNTKEGDTLKKIWLPLAILVTGFIYTFLSSFLLFKLIPMWLILLYAFLQPSGDTNAKRYKPIIMIGLFFCMLGDGLLHWFVVGLTAFLIGHLFYIAGFFQSWRFSKWRAITLIPIAAYSIIIGQNIVSAIAANGNSSMIIPVILYITVISLMAWFAIMTGNLWAIVGSLLFVASDSVLAWNKFVSDVTYSGAIIMVTYYTAQFLIAHSIGHTQEKPLQSAINGSTR